MTVQQLGLIALIKSAVSGRSIKLPKKFSLESALKTIRKHHISTLIYYGALNCGFSNNTQVMQQLFVDVCYTSSISENQLFELKKLYDEFEKNKIDYMPIKGSLTKELYPVRDMRFMCDADILIRTEQYNKIKPILLKLGYIEKYESDHELAWHKPTLFLELHKRLIPSYNLDYYSYFEDAWERAKRTDMTSSRYEMTPEDYFVFLFTHFAKHYRDGGIGIKHLVDLWQFLDKYSLDNALLEEKLIKLNLYEFYTNILNVLNTWFVDGKASNQKTDFITDAIFRSGAYGTYESHLISKSLKSVKFFGTTKKARRRYFIYLVFLPYKYMCKKYPILNNFPFILPLMWCIRLLSAVIFKPKRIKAQQKSLKIMSKENIEGYQQSLRYVGLDFNFDSDKRFTLTKTQTALLNILSVAINQNKNKPLPILPKLSESEWKSVLDESSKQSVVNLAFEGVVCFQEQIPPDLYEKWFQLATKSMLKTVQVMRSQQCMVDILEQNNLSYFILKGSASAAYYPKFDARSFGDVDFLIYPSQQSTVEDKLLKAGYRRWNKENDCHIVFCKKNEQLEMHFQISGIPYGKIGTKIREFMNGAVDKFDVVKLEGMEFKVPKPLYHGFIILLHLQHHMLGEGVGMRHLCDWACFVSKTYKCDFWQRELLPFLKEIGLFEYAKAITKTCALYLNSPCPTWASDVSKQLCFEIIQDVFMSGNFGRKNIKRSQSYILVSQHGKTGTKHGALYNLICKMDSIVKLNYPILKKAPYLYPFIYIYRSARFAVYQLTGKRDSVFELLPEAKKRRAIYEQLHIFEVK